MSFLRLPPSKGRNQEKDGDTGHERPDVGERQRDTGTLVTAGPATAARQSPRATRVGGSQMASDSEMTPTGTVHRNVPGGNTDDGGV